MKEQYFTTILEAIDSLEKVAKITPDVTEGLRQAYQNFLKTKHGKERIDQLEATCNFRLGSLMISGPTGAECLRAMGIHLEAMSFDEQPSIVAHVLIDTNPEPQLFLLREQYEQIPD